MLNLIFNVTGAATLEGISEANSRNYGLNILHFFTLVFLPSYHLRLRYQAFQMDIFFNYWYLCKIMYCDQVIYIQEDFKGIEI